MTWWNLVQLEKYGLSCHAAHQTPDTEVWLLEKQNWPPYRMSYSVKCKHCERMAPCISRRQSCSEDRLNTNYFVRLFSGSLETHETWYDSLRPQREEKKSILLCSLIYWMGTHRRHLILKIGVLQGRVFVHESSSRPWLWHILNSAYQQSSIFIFSSHSSLALTKAVKL